MHQAEDITEYVRLTEHKQRMEVEILARSRDLENADQALRQRAVTFEQQVEGAPDATVVVDRSGTIVLVNQQAEVMFGYPRQELAWRGHRDFGPRVIPRHSHKAPCRLCR